MNLTISFLIEVTLTLVVCFLWVAYVFLFAAVAPKPHNSVTK